MRPLLPFADAFRDPATRCWSRSPRRPPASCSTPATRRGRCRRRRRRSATRSSRAPARDADEANAIVIGELFAGVHARAALPGVMAAVGEWQPDVIVHETCEFAAALVAERAGAAVACASRSTWPRSSATSRAFAAARGRRAARRAGPGAATRDGERLLAGRELTLTPPALDGGRREGHYREPQAAARGAARPLGRRRAAARVRLLRHRRAAGRRLPGALPRGDRAARARSTCACCSTPGRQDPAALGPLPARRARRALGARGRRAARTWPRWSPTAAPAACARRSRPACRSRVPPRFGDQPLNARAVAGGRRRARRRRPRGRVGDDRHGAADAIPPTRRRDRRSRPRSTRCRRRERSRRSPVASRERARVARAHLSLNARMRSSYCAASRA